jgi:hypothetical protein
MRFNIGHSPLKAERLLPGFKNVDSAPECRSEASAIVPNSKIGYWGRAGVRRSPNRGMRHAMHRTPITPAFLRRLAAARGSDAPPRTLTEVG